ncbi:hypothetical protein PISMIDRAFT_680698 [Pisolithus microcarpus 441]|uniref:Uncharacterized protein n=1 Tax=Pisolithus microcarpus 441 TaxID=765257 RepID=A0A0C9YYX9_9AGAM|nr:hypothetical protein PISMIDRAFT_680698 [Pisolithus microcarpus 441]
MVDEANGVVWFNEGRVIAVTVMRVCRGSNRYIRTVQGRIYAQYEIPLRRPKR